MTPRPLSFYLSCLAILALPAYVIRFQIGFLPSTLLEILILAAIFTWAIEAFSSRIDLRTIWSRFYSPLFWPGLALVGVALAEVWVSGEVRAGLGLWRAYFLEPWLFSLVLVDLGRRVGGQYFLWSLIGSGIGVAALAISQIHLGKFIDITPESSLQISYGRAVAVFNSGNALALFLGPTTVLLAALVLKKRFYLLLPWALLCLAIVDSKSTGGLTALLSGGLITAVGYFILRVRPGLLKLFWTSSLAIFLGISVVFMIFFGSVSNFAPDMRPESGRIYNDTTVLRLCLWEGTSKILQSSPVFGAGLAGFSEAYKKVYTCDAEALRYPHNLYLNFWSETGLIGLMIVLVLISSVFIWLGRSPDPLLALGLGGAWFYLAVHGLVDVPYFKNDLAVQWWVLLVLVILVKERKLPSG